MATPTSRLHFLDSIRAFAIIMMLQGHFVHALLGDVYRDDNLIYTIWKYFRGITAPTFFTITGFIFTYLLLKQKDTGLKNPRVLLGIKRAIKVIFWGYFLRLSVFALLDGAINPSFFYVDVLQCIGTSLLLLIGLYLLFGKDNFSLFRNVILGTGIIIFMLQPFYETCILDFLPNSIANYFTNRNGSIFTLFPWFGYVCFGSFFATLFLRYQHQKLFYWYSSTVLFFIGFLLIFASSDILMLFYRISEISIFKLVAYNNFLFIRLGNVCVLFAFFILLKNYVAYPLFTKIGGKTLSIYIVHFFILYGSWLGFGLNRFFYHNLSPMYTIFGAILFVMVICALVLYYYKYEKKLKEKFVFYTGLLFGNSIKSNAYGFVSNFKEGILRIYKTMVYIKNR